VTPRSIPPTAKVRRKNLPNVTFNLRFETIRM
jgi:hypothetical protein